MRYHQCYSTELTACKGKPKDKVIGYADGLALLGESKEETLAAETLRVQAEGFSISHMYIRWYKKKVGEVSYLGFRNKNTILSEILIFGYSELCVYRSRLLGTGSRAPGALFSAASCAAAGRAASPPRRARLAAPSSGAV